MTTADTPWQPTDEQINDEIAPLLSSLHEDLEDLKASLGCPDSFIREWLADFVEGWFPGD